MIEISEKVRQKVGVAGAGTSEPTTEDDPLVLDD